MGERTYGYRAPQERDPRDLKYGVNFVAPAQRPPDEYVFGEQSGWWRPPFDQNGYSTCVFNSGAYIVAMQAFLVPGFREDLYWDSIDPQEAKLVDAVGARQGCDPLQYGCSVHDWAKVAQKIGVRAMLDGKWVRLPIGKYATVSSADDVAMAVWGHNALIHFGITVHNRLEKLTETDDVVEAWDPNDPVEGGHSMAVDGFLPDPERPGKRRLWVRNSWGNWGDAGDCLLGEEALFGGPAGQHDVTGEWLAYMPAMGLVLPD